MNTRSAVAAGVAVRFVVTLVLVVGLSWLARGALPGEKGAPVTLPRLHAEMTPAQIAGAAGLPLRGVGKALGVETPQDLQRPLGELGLDPEQARQALQRAAALKAEESSKDFRKILAKFGLWLVFLAAVLVLMRRRAVSPGVRVGLLAGAAVVFGVLFGPDQSPMGTVKDSFVLWGKAHALFPPRLIALAVFLALVVGANKFICAWGCQFGVLQDLVFRLNRDRRDQRGRLRQYKPPFVVANSVRVAFFAVFVSLALLGPRDVIEPVDPFTIYNPAKLGLLGGGAVVLLLLLSLVVYRPWCHFLCPFGLVGWLAERLSLNRVRVDYETCVACEACARACPSTVMEAILKQDRVTPDCFACGVCLQACPTKSISFDGKRRQRVPAGKFAEREAQARPSPPAEPAGE